MELAAQCATQPNQARRLINAVANVGLLAKRCVNATKFRNLHNSYAVKKEQ